ncbi:hypothetical protein ICM05_06405 [Leucobacter sp. cx-42]|uniref:hypothetical protein n=1 Tax=unclassified Leucobacter TaxID=2621730 RepID=UPI00165E1AB8|nr:MULTISPECIES: hypothetical protein [unclassified Leucobacter]MBC9954278.1 hypothetical protein [Leucobacter sp. cx-42]
MSKRAPHKLVTVLLAFLLFTPTFWVIDILESVSAGPNAGATTQTLRFDESRTEKESLEKSAATRVGEPDDTDADDANAVRSDDKAFSGLCEDDLGFIAPQADTAVAASGMGAQAHSNDHGPVHWTTPEVRLPSLTPGERVQLGRLLMPAQPVAEVPTTPPLIAA